MNRTSTGLGSLVFQPQYARDYTRSARYAARFYRPIIFGATFLILLATYLKYWQASFWVHAGFVIALAGYMLIFIGRLRLKGSLEHRFYHPGIQFARGQASLLSLTLLIAVLAAHGLYDHNLWLLYVLATMLISEHNSTATALWTLFQVAALYVLAVYIGWGIYNGEWLAIWRFWSANPNLGVNILGIWLVNFVFHYLLRNIHGRDLTYEQHRAWLNLVAEEWTASSQPTKQRQALLARAEELAKAQVELWLPRLKDNQLVNTSGQLAGSFIAEIASNSSPVIAIQGDVSKLSMADVTIRQLPPAPGVQAKIVIPIRQLDGGADLLGLLDISYTASKPPFHCLQRDCWRLMDLANYARLLLRNGRYNEQLQLEQKLAARLHQLFDIERIVEQVVNDVVDELGFDISTISLVDYGEDLIRCESGKNAEWVKDAIHPIHSDDVQSLIVKTGGRLLNDGSWERIFDGRIYNRYKHWRFVRVWVPIPDPSADKPYPALGTIEAGFYRAHRKEIPSHLITSLERYARQVGLALTNARLHQRARQLAHKLTSLHAISQMLQRNAAFCEPQQMIELIGESAEKLLESDIVMVYTLDENSGTVALPYVTPHAVYGKSELIVSLDGGVLHKLYTEQQPHFSADARKDPLLVNLKPDEKLDRRNRTFTQRQNIKSFAGVPLIGKRSDVLGFLCANYRRRLEFHEEARQLVKLFAEQAAVALEETNHHRLARRLAISQERSNLGAELHHTLSQNLWGLKQYADSTMVYARRNQMPRVITSLNKVVVNIELSLYSLEELLLSLQEQPRAQSDFVNEFHEYIQRMRCLHPGMEMHFDPQVEANAPGQVQFYLLRIAREALNNALRHSHSPAIAVTYSVTSGGVVTLSVRDDGLGFDLEKARHSGRFGLSSMDYYAHQINSQVVINSKIGAGTHLSIQVVPPAKGEKR